MELFRVSMATNLADGRNTSFWHHSWTGQRALSMQPLELLWRMVQRELEHDNWIQAAARLTTPLQKELAFL
jgi:hypothetical protein